MTTDPTTPLIFVDPDETESTYRVCLWAAPGQGKSVAAASAPAPILVLTADRPSAYKFARKHHSGKDIREVRYRDAGTLDQVYAYLRSEEGQEIRTLVVDPVSSIYDQLVDTAPVRNDGDPDWQRVNKKLLGFIQSLRKFDINVVLVAHEKVSDGKKGDGKLYPQIGGPALINKVLAEMDIVAHIERRVTRPHDSEEELVRWVGQLQPRDNLVCKESTGCLGDIRIADLTRWFEVATEGLKPDESDVPWGEGFEGAETDGDGKAEAAGDDPEVAPDEGIDEARGQDGQPDPGAGDTAKAEPDPDAGAAAEADQAHAAAEKPDEKPKPRRRRTGKAKAPQPAAAS